MAGENNLGRFIKECRTGLGFTSRKVEELSRTRPGLTTISHSNLLAIEKGAHVPTFDKVLTLSLLFNVPTRQFEDHLKRDMLASPPGATAAPFEKLLDAARAAAEMGEDQRALDLFVEAHGAALAEDARSPSPWTAECVAEARLHAANCRARLGLVRVAKDDLEEILAAPGTPPLIVARATFLLAELHRELKNHRLALLHARAALEQASALGDAADPRLRGKILNALGNVHDELGEHEKALGCYAEAFDVFRRLSDRRACGLIARNLGEAYMRRQDYAPAIRSIEEGLAAARDTGDRRGTAYGLANLGRAHYLSGDLAAAKDAARQAKEIAQSENYLDVLFSSIFCLWRIAEKEHQSSLSRVYSDRLAVLHRKLETRCAESEEWSQHLASSRRTRS